MNKYIILIYITILLFPSKDIAAQKLQGPSKQIITKDGSTTTIRSYANNVTAEPLWTIDAPTGGWFMTDNNTRGLAYNPATGNLIVASRSGGLKPVVIDAATGDSVGLLSTADVLLSEDFEGITATGDAVTGWSFDNAKTYNLSGYGNNSDKYAGWGESSAADHSITSPAVVDPGVLTYYVAAFNDNTNTKVLVQVSSDSTNWTTLDTLTSKGAGGDFGVTFLKKTLTINGKGAHQIRWKTDSYVSGGFYLDDISVTAPIVESGVTFPYNQIRATEDGQIFTASLSINAVTRIYRWASESDHPKLVFSDSLGQRLGDSFGVFGAGDSVTVLLSGTGATKVVAFSWNGTALSKVADLPVAASEARGGFSSRTVNNNTIITGTGTAPRFMNVVTGELGPQIKSTQLAETDLNTVMLNDQFIVDGFHVMVAGPAFTNGKFYVLDITSPGNAKVAYEFDPLGENDNLNNTGGVIFDEETLRLYLMDTNNSLQAFKFDDTIFSSDSTVMVESKSVFVEDSTMVGIYLQGMESEDQYDSFQFDLTIPEGLAYLGTDTTGTLSSQGLFQTNVVEDTLKVAYASSQFASGNNLLIRLRFKGLEEGSYEIIPRNILIKSDPSDNVIPGLITVNNPIQFDKGDVNGDSRIVAHDAAITLQYSVGKDPLPQLDPLPWEQRRIVAADVNSDGQVLAQDAALILQKVVGLITDFPSANKDVNPVISISAEDGHLRFSTTQSGLIGFNVRVPLSESYTIGNPKFASEDLLSAHHADSEAMRVGAASASSIEGAFMELPLDWTSGEPTGSLSVEVYSNNERRELQVPLKGLSTSVVGDLSDLPGEYALHQNHPNPFNPVTTITYALPVASDVTLEVFNVMGQRVAVLVKGMKQAGTHTVQFDAIGFSSGMYVARLTTAEFTASKVMVLLK